MNTNNDALCLGSLRLQLLTLVSHTSLLEMLSVLLLGCPVILPLLSYTGMRPWPWEARKRGDKNHLWLVEDRRTR